MTPAWPIVSSKTLSRHHGAPIAGSVREGTFDSIVEDGAAKNLTPSDTSATGLGEVSEVGDGVEFVWV